jgi:hypothetical protein
MAVMQFREEMGSRMTEVVMDLRTGKATKRMVGGAHTGHIATGFTALKRLFQAWHPAHWVS